MDFFVILASWTEIIIDAATGGGGGFLSQFRLLRVLRVIRLVGMFEKLAMLVEVPCSPHLKHHHPSLYT